MGKVFLLLLFLSLIGFLTYHVFSKEEEKLISPLSPSPTIVLAKTKTVKTSFSKKSIFIPYWTFDKKEIDVKNYDQLIYFGLGVNKEGIDQEDGGYKKIDQFITLSDSKKERLLAIRMIDSTLNSEVLRNKILQKKIAEESIIIAEKYGFNGLVLDFELSGISFDSAIKETSDFIKLFYSLAKKEDLFFSITIPGDSFYRFKPYDVSVLAKSSDQIFVMAYDFFKARGNPGPNFPFSGKEIYGYDFVGMVDDFTRVVSSDKLTVVFGLFGYDWTIDNKNRSIGSGEALSFLKIKEKFLDNCSFTKCSTKKDKESSQTFINYLDEEGSSHVVWLEDPESVAKKEKYLKEKGLNSISFWAYSFF